LATCTSVFIHLSIVFFFYFLTMAKGLRCSWAIFHFHFHLIPSVILIAQLVMLAFSVEKWDFFFLFPLFLSQLMRWFFITGARGVFFFSCFNISISDTSLSVSVFFLFRIGSRFLLQIYTKDWLVLLLLLSLLLRFIPIFSVDGRVLLFSCFLYEISSLLSIHVYETRIGVGAIIAQRSPSATTYHVQWCRH